MLSIQKLGPEKMLLLRLCHNRVCSMTHHSRILKLSQCHRRISDVRFQNFLVLSCLSTHSLEIFMGIIRGQPGRSLGLSTMHTLPHYIIQALFHLFIFQEIILGTCMYLLTLTTHLHLFVFSTINVLQDEISRLLFEESMAAVTCGALFCAV